MSAKFEAHDIFKIHGRGPVIPGWVREGTIKIGMSAAIPEFPQKQRVQGIEIFSKFNRPKELDRILGLLFPFGSEAEEALWKKLDIKDHIINIE